VSNHGLSWFVRQIERIGRVAQCGDKRPVRSSAIAFDSQGAGDAERGWNAPKERSPELAEDAERGGRGEGDKTGGQKRPPALSAR
jgi:hypothetical protein